MVGHELVTNNTLSAEPTYEFILTSTPKNSPSHLFLTSGPEMKTTTSIIRTTNQPTIIDTCFDINRTSFIASVPYTLYPTHCTINPT